jgi:hypothetical protein
LGWKAIYNGKNVHPYRFILSMHFIKECALESKRDIENCWLNVECQGWGCKKIANISYQELGDGNYESNNRYWYNFGRFNSKNEWVIDKTLLLSNLLQFVKENGLYLCPHFSEKKVKDSVDKLQSKIIPDDISYRIHYTEIFDKGKMINFPENIRHISTQYQDRGTRLEYDLDKIRIIRRREDGEISDEAMNDLLNKDIDKN